MNHLRSDGEPDWRACRFDSGLGLVTVARPHAPVTAALALVAAGSRHDAGDGCAHLLEHLLFRGTATRSGRALYDAVERYGGTIDGHTAREYLRLAVVLQPDQLPLGLTLLGELLAEPLLHERDFWEEKLVLLQELRRSHDSINHMYDRFCGALWPGSPLGRPIGGDARCLGALEHRQLREFYKRHVVADRVVVVVAGPIEHARVRELTAAAFARLDRESAPLSAPAAPPTPPAGPGRVFVEKQLHQTQLLVGFPTGGFLAPDRSALAVAERVLGVGGSSRLFQLLREREQLAYEVSTVAARYSDAGYLAARVSCLPEHTQRVERLLLEQFHVLAAEGITEAELARAQSSYLGQQAHQLESTLAVARVFGVQAILADQGLHQIEPPPVTAARIRQVTCADVQQAARGCFTAGAGVSVAVGPRDPWPTGGMT